MNRSTLFLLVIWFSLPGCGNDKRPTNPATPPADISKKTSFATPNRSRDRSENLLDYLKVECGVSPISPDKGGGYYFSNYFTSCREEDLPLLSQVEDLRSFNLLNGNPFSPAGWEQIGRITGLETFYCQDSSVSDQHLLGLRDLSHLRDLQIIRRGNTGNPITDQGLKALTGMTELRRLVLHSRGINVRACELIGDCKKLRSLEIHGPVTDECLKSLGMLENLRHLFLEGTFSDEGLAHLGGLKHIERLVVVSNHLQGSGLRYLSDFSELRELGFSGSAVKSVTLEQLDRWPTLVTLNLAYPAVNDSVLRTLPHLPNLKTLSLRGSSITDEGLDALENVKGLTELDLKFTGITNGGLTRLQPLKQLRVLALGNPARPNLITGNGLTPLSLLSSLEKLNICHVDTEKLDLSPLGKAPSLMEVNLTVRTERWQKVQEQRPGVKKVEEIILVSRRVFGFGIKSNEIP